MKIYPKIIMVGPQGSGKGTQAAKLSRRLKIPHISAGEELRKEMAKGSALGKKITSTMNAGILIPDRDTNNVMKQRLNQRSFRHGWISDGYPRRLGQSKPMLRFAPANLIILLELKDKTAITRLSGRRVCPHGHVYHLRHDPPRKRRGYCDHDGLPLKLRDDDSPSAIRKRLSIYHNETEPMLSWFRQQTGTTIITVDARPGIDQVYHQAISKLKKIPWLSSQLKQK